MAEHELFPNNSDRAKEERALAERTERTKPRREYQLVPREHKEDTGLKKFAHRFLSEDANDIGTYLIDEILIPMAKDAYMSFMDTLLYGNRGGYYKGVRSDRKSGQTNYNRIYNNSSSSVRRSEQDARRSGRENAESYKNNRRNDILNGLVFPSKQAAQDMIEEMYDEIDINDQVTFGFLCDRICGVEPESTDDYVGWRTLNGYSIKSVSDGYLLKLPRMERLR